MKKEEVRMQGKVVLTKNSWGFIQPADPILADVFYHRSCLQDNRKRLLEGEDVEFEIGERDGKPIAKEVRVVPTQPVKGQRNEL